MLNMIRGVALVTLMSSTCIALADDDNDTADCAGRRRAVLVVVVGEVLLHALTTAFSCHKRTNNKAVAEAMTVVPRRILVGRCACSFLECEWQRRVRKNIDESCWIGKVKELDFNLATKTPEDTKNGSSFDIE